MKKLIGVLLGVVAAVGGQSIAQETVDKIAFVFWECTEQSVCRPNVAVIDSDGSNMMKVTSSFAEEPVWSPDASRLAFTDGFDSDVFVVPAEGGTPVNLTSNGWGYKSLGWSPDGNGIAAVAGDDQIVIVPAIGGRPVNVTGSVGQDWYPAWSPDGTTIAFVSDRAQAPNGFFDLYVMNPGGSGSTRITAGVNVAGRPSWSQDGMRLTFTCHIPSLTTYDVCAVNSDGTGFAVLTLDTPYYHDFDPVFSPDGTKIAFATTRYGGWTNCPDDRASALAVMSADGSGVGLLGPALDEGFAVGPRWSPDGARISFVHSTTYFHEFEGGAGYECGSLPSVYVMATDGTGVTWLAAGNSPEWKPQGTPIPNHPPIASFTAACTMLMCTFDGLGSSDPDGTIASHAWYFGDGTTGSGAAVSHTYATAGTYSVILTVIDSRWAMSTAAQTITVVPPDMHIGDLDGASTTGQNTWNVTVMITIHDSSHGPLASVAVSGAWDDGSAGSCTTNASGQCAVSRSGIPRRITSASFPVTNVARPPSVYKPADNHDPDGDSDGTSINVHKP